MCKKIKKLIIEFGYTAYKIVRIPIKWYWKLFHIETKGVRVMIINQDKVVLVRHWYNSLWVMPGGGIKKHETPERAAVREIKEELGIEIEQLDYLLGVYSNKKEGKNDTVYTYVVKLFEHVTMSKRRFNFEISDILWVPLDDLPPGTSIATRNRVQEYIDGNISKTVRVW